MKPLEPMQHQFKNSGPQRSPFMHACACLVAILSLFSCGTETGNPGDGGKPSGKIILDDNTVAAASLSAQVGDALEAMSDQGSADTSTTSLGLVESEPTTEVSCTSNAAEKKVTVAGSVLGTRVRNTKLKTGTLTISSDIDFNFTNVWIGDAATCRTTKAIAKVNWKNADGLTFQTEFKSSVKKSTSLVTVKGNTIQGTSKTFEKQGHRSIIWSGVALKDSEATFTQTIESKIEHAMSVENSKKESVKVESSSEISKENPLIVSIVRDTRSEPWKTKTLRSGKISSIHKDGSKLETTFENVVYDYSDRCIPSSGTISGRIFNPEDLKNPTQTFTVTFVAGIDAVVKFSSGEEMNYEPLDCLN
jgi:hypothetical protein